jgi:hypothetical protein
MTQVRIQKDSEVRLRIVGTRNDANEIVRGPLPALSLRCACADALYRSFALRSSAWAPLRTTTWASSARRSE